MTGAAEGGSWDDPPEEETHDAVAPACPGVRTLPRRRASGRVAGAGLGAGARCRRRAASCEAGTDQDLQVLNPWQSVVVADFEAFTLNYDPLVGYGQDIEPVPGFAESWEQSEDGLTWTSTSDQTCMVGR